MSDLIPLIQAIGSAPLKPSAKERIFIAVAEAVIEKQPSRRGRFGHPSNKEDQPLERLIDALPLTSQHTRGLLMDLSGNVSFPSLPASAANWIHAYQQVPKLPEGMRLTADQIIVVSRDVREVLSMLGITPEWIRQRLAALSPNGDQDLAKEREETQGTGGAS